MQKGNGLNLASAKLKTVHVTKLALLVELRMIRYNLLHEAWTNGGIIYVVYVYIY
jgi:hypothetical protein